LCRATQSLPFRQLLSRAPERVLFCIRTLGRRVRRRMRGTRECAGEAESRTSEKEEPTHCVVRRNLCLSANC